MGGSSPLARGTLLIAILVVRLIGLIPARAGNTFSQTEMLIKERAHPRSRGEHVVGDSHFDVAEGSSPLARGTRVMGCF